MERKKARAGLGLHHPGVMPLGDKLILGWITQKEHGICLFQVFPPFCKCILSQNQKDPSKPTSHPHIHIILL